uniref:F-box domain-containing protein n=1 Tax=Oryza punctata TaxID=4537 RepID=A0A0E0LZU1_ORYPU
MAGTDRSRRRREGKLRKAWRKEAATAGPTGVDDVPDEVLELVLLRLGNSLALLRAAATGGTASSRTPGSSAGSRSLHAPLVVGHYHVVDPTFTGAQRGGNHVIVPERSPSPTLPRLPAGAGWRPRMLGARRHVLLYQKTWNVSFPDMLVCEPLTRRHQGILRPQEMKYRKCFGVFLIDGGAAAAADETGGCISMSNFRALSAIYESETPYWYGHGTPPRPRAYVFSTDVEGGWRATESDSGSDVELPSFQSINFMGRAGCCLYWGLGGEDAVLALDKTTAEFSPVTIPAIVGEPYHPSTSRVIGGGNDGTMRVGSGGEWVVEKLVRLPPATCGLPGHDKGLFHDYARIITANERNILVTPRVATWLFSVEVETSVVEHEHVRNKYAGAAYPYELPWPPGFTTSIEIRRLKQETNGEAASPAMATTGGRRCQRQRRDKHKRDSSRKVALAGDRASAPTTVDDIPDHLLVVILLRLDSSVSLIRAAAACTRWRRVVADAGFLRSFRSLRGTRHVAGLYHTVDPCFGAPPAGGSSVVFVPSSTVIGLDSRFFSLNFLPDYDDNNSWSWELVDSRGGLLLFSKKRKSTRRWVTTMAEAGAHCFPDLVVCEPLTRRYQGIVSPVYFRRHQCLGVFLLDGGAADADETGGFIGMSNFRVVAALHDHTWQHDRAVPLACVFTSGSDGGWCVLQSATDAAAAVDLPERFDYINFAGRAGRCVYWGIDDEDGAMLVLDETTMRFSIDMFPETIRASYDKWTFRVIGGGDDGALRVVRVMSNDLKVFAQIAGSGEWVVERLVRLPEATRELPGRRETFFRQEAKIVAANAAYVLLTPQEKKKWLFSVELETGKVEHRHERNRYAGAAYSYELPWPPEGRRRRRRHRRKKASTKQLPAAAAAATVQDVPDHVLETILLRVDSSACLVRAAASCRRWRRVVADAGFLHSFRSLHGAHRVAGVYHTVDPAYGRPLPGGNFVFVPSTTLAAGVDDDSCCFALDFLPDGGRDLWELVDCRGGLLLLSKKSPGFGGVATARRFTDLVVCEPLTRRYQVLPYPANLNFFMCLGVFLLDAGHDAAAGGRAGRMSSFRVIAVLFDRHMWLDYRGMPMSIMFSSSDGDGGTWQVVQGETIDDVDLPGWIEHITFVGRGNGRLYWGIENEDGATLVLDERTTEFSITMFPENVWAPYDKYTFRVIGGDGDGDDGALRVVRVINNDLKVFTQLTGSGGDWVLEKMVSLPEATRGMPWREEGFFQHGEAMIVAANAAYVLVTPREKAWIFSVELETMEVEREHERNRYPGAAYQYESLPWPPALRACTDILEREMR